MLHYKPNCPLSVHYHRARSFILINLPLTSSLQVIFICLCAQQKPLPNRKGTAAEGGPVHPPGSAEGLHRSCTRQQISAALTSNKRVSGWPQLRVPPCRKGASPGLCHSAAAAPWDAPFPMAALQALTCFTWDSSSLWEVCQNSAKFSSEREKLFLKISFRAKRSEAWD